MKKTERAMATAVTGNCFGPAETNHHEPAVSIASSAKAIRTLANGMGW